MKSINESQIVDVVNIDDNEQEAQIARLRKEISHLRSMNNELTAQIFRRCLEESLTEKGLTKCKYVVRHKADETGIEYHIMEKHSDDSFRQIVLTQHQLNSQTDMTTLQQLQKAPLIGIYDLLRGKYGY